MKKLLLSLSLAFVCAQVSHAAQDLPLSLNDFIIHDENSDFDPATGKLIIGVNWSPAVGWDLPTPVSSKDYYGVKVVFKGKQTTGFVDLKAKYENGAFDDLGVGIPTGVRSIILGFDEDRDVAIDHIYFQCSNWEGDAAKKFPDNPPWPFIMIESITFLAHVNTERVPLSLDDVITDWWGAIDVDVTAKTVTLHNNWEFVGWNVDRGVSNSGIELTEVEPGFYAISDEIYMGCEYNFDPFEFERTDCLVNTFEDGGGIYQHVDVGATKKKIYFSEPMFKVGFQYSNYDGYEQDMPVFKNLDVYLLKRVPTGVKKITADAGSVDVYTILGVKIRSNVEAVNALDGLERGIYIVNGKKVFVTK